MLSNLMFVALKAGPTDYNSLELELKGMGMGRILA